MKIPLLLLSGALSIFLFSCKKEVSNENGGGGNSSNGTLLVRSVYKQGTDSSTSNYTYDGSRRLTSINNVSTDAGSSVSTTINLVRSSAGIIQRVNIKSDQFAQFGIDSLISVVNYDAATSRYKSKVITVDILFGTIKDSIAYEYDASGKIIRERDFVDDGTAGGYEEISKNEYTYNGSNLVSVKYYTYEVSTNTYTLDETDTFEYDSKTNALQLGNEAFLISDVSAYSANNMTKQTVDVTSDPTLNQTSTTTYTYNSNNRPSTSSIVVQPGGGTATNTYTYQ